MDTISLGVVGTARIALETVIPAMQKCRHLKVSAIASRDAEKASAAAGRLGIPRSYGSYSRLLEDPAIDAVYIPLPNHLHVPWAIRALQAGKHVLCEKPLGLSASEVDQLLEVSRDFPELKVTEAFMYRHHPRWRSTLELIRDDAIGHVHSIVTTFSYHNDDPSNIRNHARMGGGALMDIGCYPVSLSRFLFGREPDRTVGVVQIDPVFKVDRLASGILDFTTGTSLFTCSGRSCRDQHVKIVGERGMIEMDQPFRPSVTEPTRLLVTREDKLQVLDFDPCDQFTIQGDRFALAILEDRPVEVPLEDSLKNMKILDALKKGS